MTEQQLQTMRDALVSSIAEAFERLRSGDKSVTCQNIDQMQRALKIYCPTTTISGRSRIAALYNR